MRVTITTEYIKLDSFLKLCGAASTGGHAKYLVEEGQVTVDGAVCLMRGKKLRGGEKVTVEGQEFEVARCI